MNVFSPQTDVEQINHLASEGFLSFSAYFERAVEKDSFRVCSRTLGCGNSQVCYKLVGVIVGLY